VKLLKKILLGLVVLLVAIQFVRPAKNIAPRPSENDITDHYPTPPAVKQLLAVACYDCHSNTTRYPWYANVQPAAWFLASHVNDGKAHLNFSEFYTYSPKRAASKLDQVIDEVTDHEMPLASYKLGHPDARLTPAQSKLLTDWADGIRQQILAANGLAE
jgi:hypothetical protein